MVGYPEQGSVMPKAVGSDSSFMEKSLWLLPSAKGIFQGSIALFRFEPSLFEPLSPLLTLTSVHCSMSTSLLNSFKPRKPIMPGTALTLLNY